MEEINLWHTNSSPLSFSKYSLSYNTTLSTTLSSLLSSSPYQPFRLLFFVSFLQKTRKRKFWNALRNHNRAWKTKTQTRITPFTSHTKITILLYGVSDIFPRWKWTNQFFLMGIHNDLLWPKKGNFSFSSTHPPYNGPGNLIRKYNTVMLYTIIIVVFLFLIVCFSFVKSLVLKALIISQSLSIFRLFLFEQVFPLCACKQMKNFLCWYRLTFCIYISNKIISPLLKWWEVYYRSNFTGKILSDN